MHFLNVFIRLKHSNLPKAAKFIADLVVISEEFNDFNLTNMESSSLN